MSKFPSLGTINNLPGNVRRSDLEERIRQLRAARSDAWSLAYVPYTAMLCFQGLDSGDTEGARRIYFRPRNPQESTSVELRISGGGSEKEYTVTDSAGNTVCTLTTDTSGDGYVVASYRKVHETDTDYYFELDGDATWSVDDADLAVAFNTIGLVPPASLDLGVQGPTLPAGGRMMAEDWNTFFTDVENDYNALVSASSFYQMRFACMVHEPTNSWTSKDPRSVVLDIADKNGGETLERADLWACGSNGRMQLELDNNANQFDESVIPSTPAHSRVEVVANFDTDGSGVGTPISAEITELLSTTTLSRTYAVLYCRPLWE